MIFNMIFNQLKEKNEKKRKKREQIALHLPLISTIELNFCTMTKTKKFSPIVRIIIQTCDVLLIYINVKLEVLFKQHSIKHRLRLQFLSEQRSEKEKERTKE